MGVPVFLIVVFAFAGVTCIDFKRNEAHKYFVRNPNGEDFCNRINCTMNANFGTVNFYLFNRYNPEVPFLLNEFNINNINPSLETKVILHGWNEGYNATWVIDMKNTFLSVGDYNVILPDYYYYTSQPIMMECCYIRSFSEVIGYFLAQLPAQIGLDLKKVHIVGASLGAQVGGIAGDTIKIYTNGVKVGRITGLDTTFMSFRGRPISDRLTPDDADFVDIIHTNSGDMGYPDPHGHIDFYPNCGVTQPQCANETGAIKTLCDHSMSHVFYNRTIFYPTAYIAVECLSCDDFYTGRCNGNRRVIMGENTPTISRGIYFIEILDDLRPLIIEAINAGEFDDNPPPSLQGNQIVEERQNMGEDNSTFGGFGFFRTTTTSTTTENPVYPNPFSLSNLREPGSQYQRGLIGLGSNPDPAGDRLRAQAATSTTTTTTQRPRGNRLFQDSFLDDIGSNFISGNNRRFNERAIPTFMRVNRIGGNLNFNGNFGSYNENAALLGAESKNDPYGSTNLISYPQSNYIGGYATPSPLGQQIPGLPSGNPAVYNERYLANRFNLSLDNRASQNRALYQNNAYSNSNQQMRIQNNFDLQPRSQNNLQGYTNGQQSYQENYYQQVTPRAQESIWGAQPDLRSSRPLTRAQSTVWGGQPDLRSTRPLTRAQSTVWGGQPDLRSTRPLTRTQGNVWGRQPAGNPSRGTLEQRSDYDYDYDNNDQGSYQFYTSFNNKK